MNEISNKNESHNNKLIIGIIIGISIVIIFFFLPLRTIDLDETNIANYLEIKAEVINYEQGELYQDLGIAGATYYPSTAQIKVTVKPKIDTSYNDVKLEFEMTSIMWAVKSDDNMFYFEVPLDDLGNAQKTVDIKSTTMGILAPESKPELNDILDISNVSGNVRQPIIQLK